jgi:hypothetical protein
MMLAARARAAKANAAAAKAQASAARWHADPQRMSPGDYYDGYDGITIQAHDDPATDGYACGFTISLRVANPMVWLDERYETPGHLHRVVSMLEQRYRGVAVILDSDDAASFLFEVSGDYHPGDSDDTLVDRLCAREGFLKAQNDADNLEMVHAIAAELHAEVLQEPRDIWL